MSDSVELAGGDAYFDGATSWKTGAGIMVEPVSLNDSCEMLGLPWSNETEFKRKYQRTYSGIFIALMWSTRIADAVEG